jgi:hypothetical protein
LYKSRPLRSALQNYVIDDFYISFNQETARTFKFCNFVSLEVSAYAISVNGAKTVAHASVGSMAGGGVGFSEPPAIGLSAKDMLIMNWSIQDG